MCDYDPIKIQSLNAKDKNKYKTKPIICIETGQEFESATECAKVSVEVFGVQMIQSKINSVCNEMSKSHHGYSFKYKNPDDIDLSYFIKNKLAKEVCLFKNENPETNTKEISEIFKIHRCTVRDYLIKGTKLGWCNYNPKEESRKSSSKSGLNHCIKVEVFKDGSSCGIYESASSLERISEDEFKVKFIQSSISAVCVGKRRSHKGYTFKYIS